MSTPFDDITWKLRFTGIIPRPTHTTPVAPTETQGMAAIVQQQVMENPVMAHPGSTNTSQYHLPLRSLSFFTINITKGDGAEIIFSDSTYVNIKSVWDKAQNVYYDREFYAIRGDLMYDLETGLPSPSFGKHFVISYDGRMATGGSSRQLSVHLVNEEEISTPTYDLLFYLRNLPYHRKMDHGGSWKADD